MIQKIRLWTIAFSLLFLAATAFAQPANDECSGAIFLDDVSSWCSGNGEFTNVGATVSAVPASDCFINDGQNNDVWFAFTAEATDVNINVVGDTEINGGGTLQGPQFALYEGSCGALEDVACAVNAFNNNSIQIFASQLQIGQTYFIQVSGLNLNTGTFRLCVNNFNQPAEPSGDCATATILCNKDPFTLSQLTGVGNVLDDISDSQCESPGCPLEEFGSTWYKWTCDQPGTLAFTLTPLNPETDLDFILYELTNGIDDCSSRQSIRCMASGANLGIGADPWDACTGPTGLAINDGDVGELCGCAPTDNNFAQAIDMVAGRSYALVINNFDQNGDGFSIEFSGTGTFLGPMADFTISQDTVCVGDPVTITDASSFSGVIASRFFSFGDGASPGTLNGPGPHQVTYRRPGLKSIVLQVRSDDDCLVTAVGTVLCTML